MLKMAGVVTGLSRLPIAFKNKWFKRFLANEAFVGAFKSPSTTPFIDALPLPLPPREAPFIPDLNATSDPTLTSRDIQNARFFQFILEEAEVSLHGELPPTRIWRYRDMTLPSDETPNLGPILVADMGLKRKTIFVRYTNKLPADHQGFGIPCATAHYHGSHVEGRSDGYRETVLDGPHPFPAPLVIVPEAVHRLIAATDRFQK